MDTETHFEHEMNKCLEEINKIQTKAKELQQQKIEQDAIKRTKVGEIGPNMDLMKDWLDKYNDAEEYSKIVNEIPRTNISHANDCKCNCGSPPDFSGAAQMKRIDSSWSCKGETCTMVKNDKLQLRKSFSYTKHHHTGNSFPTEFMKEFIEATYNLFTIQQKRIEDLESLDN